ncbi:MAG TPA: hypothetical protein VF116_05040 [Ktedonobacterales bacterium]
MVIRFGPYMVPVPPPEAILAVVVPVLIGFAWIWRDANRRGQPGLLWALLTLPLSWLAVLAYVFVRALQSPPLASRDTNAASANESPPSP